MISSYEGTSSPWTNQSVAWCARDTYGMKVASLQTIEYFAHMHDWLGMIPEEAKTNFLEFTAATYIKCTWIKGSHFFHPNIYLMNNMKAMVTKLSTLGWCSTWIMGETKCCWWAQQQLIGISISLDFHHHVNTVIALVRPKDVIVYARGINHE